MEWYDYEQDERIKEVFSKYTIKDFLEWWQNNSSNVMEVRITDFNLITKIAKQLNYPYSRSGIYIQTEHQFKQVIKHIRDNNVVAWFGINSRKQNYNKYGFKGFGGLDCNVNNIEHLFIDIDRINKIGQATKEELAKCDALSKHILEKLEKQGWANRYVKLCTGNGVQLLITLDIPLKLPNVGFDMNTKSYGISDEMEQLKSVIREGVGKEVFLFSKKFRDELNVEVDKTGFNIGRVGSLPFTKNFKYGGFTWRGIIEMKSGVNSGLTDYCLMKVKDLKKWKAQTVFVKHKNNHKNVVDSKDLMNHPLVRFLLDNDLPHGQINNLLWMQLKCILRDNNLKFDDVLVRELHKQLMIKYKDNFPTNFPELKYQFKEEIINRYCANNLLPPLFPLEKLRVIREPFVIENLDWNIVSRYDSCELFGEDIFDDMRICKSELNNFCIKNGKCYFNNKIYKFTNGCIKRYGERVTKYFFDYWFERYIGWR